MTLYLNFIIRLFRVFKLEPCIWPYFETRSGPELKCENICQTGPGPEYKCKNPGPARTRIRIFILLYFHILFIILVFQCFRFQLLIFFINKSVKKLKKNRDTDHINFVVVIFGNCDLHNKNTKFYLFTI